MEAAPSGYRRLVDTEPVRVVAVPGLGLDATSWQLTLDEMAAADASVGDPSVILLQGFGEPTDGNGRPSPRDLAHELLARCPEGPLVLLGHSASCQVVAHAAGLAPGRVRALVLVGPSTDPRAWSWSRLGARLVASLPRETKRIIPSNLRQYLLTGVPSMRRVLDVARRDRLDVTLADVSCPVLVVRGQADRVAPADWADHLARQGVAAGEGAALTRSSTLSSGAHMVPRTFPAELGQVIAHFLADVRTLSDADSAA